MDIGFDHNDWRPAPAQRAFAGGLSTAPEWLALQARLSAAWAARRELAADLRCAAQRCGSFDRDSARAMAGFENVSPVVNPITLGNRKPGGGNALQHAGDLTSGVRGR